MWKTREEVDLGEQLKQHSVQVMSCLWWSVWNERIFDEVTERASQCKGGGATLRRNDKTCRDPRAQVGQIGIRLKQSRVHFIISGGFAPIRF